MEQKERQEELQFIGSLLRSKGQCFGSMMGEGFDKIHSHCLIFYEGPSSCIRGSIRKSTKMAMKLISGTLKTGNPGRGEM